jgi:hypothetical protein
VDFGFERGALKVEKGMGEVMFDFTTVRAIREDFNGLGEHLLGSWSSSSQPRFRFVDMFTVAGSIFSTSTSAKGLLLAGDAPNVKQSVRMTLHVWSRAEESHTILLVLDVHFCLKQGAHTRCIEAGKGPPHCGRSHSKGGHTETAAETNRTR